MKQFLVFSVIICLIVIFGACSDDSNPVTSAGPRIFDPFALWDTASGQLGSQVRCLVVKDTFLFAGTLDSGVYRSTNNGESWTKSSSGLSGASLIINALLVKDSNLFAGTDDGVYLSTDKGSSWNISNTGISSAVLSLVKKDTVLFAGTTGRLYCSTDDGLSWDEPGLVVPGNVTTLVVKGSRLFAGKGSNGVSRSTDNGSTWITINDGLLGYTIYSLAVKDTNLFAATNRGVFRSSNDSSWTETNDGLYSVPSDPRSFFVYGSNILVGFPNYNGIFLSLNNGASWVSCNGGLPGFSAYAFVYNGTYLFVGGENQTAVGAVWRHGL
jgi:hypothetical protein